jgi:hypothetical protein
MLPLSVREAFRWVAGGGVPDAAGRIASKICLTVVLFRNLLDDTMGEQVRTRTSTHFLGDDGIVRTVLDEGAEETLADAKASIASIVRVSNGMKRPLLVDLRGVKSQDRGARVYYSGPESVASTLGTAILVGSPVSRMLGNFFLGFNKPAIQIKLFTSEADAIQWLKELLP